MLVPSTMAGAVSKNPHIIRITKSQMNHVMWIHHCEEGSNGWHINGPLYYGGLGWLSATWNMFRQPWMPLVMSNATVREQAWAMVQFAKTYGWPDSYGRCYGY